MKALKYLKIIAGAGISLFLMNFAFLSEDKLRWEGSLPRVEVKVHPGNFGPDAGDATQIIATLRGAGLSWFKSASSPFSFSFENNRETAGAPGMDTIECAPPTDPMKKKLSVAYLYAETRPDPDCTGESCVFIWSCTGSQKIARADVQFNSYDNRFTSGSASANHLSLKSSAVHALGHVLGLDHCDSGDTPEYCATRLGDGQVNPNSTAVMHAVRRDRSVPAEDDVLGVQALYGVLDLPFPTEGRYALSSGDVRDISFVIWEMGTRLKTKADWHRINSGANRAVMTPQRTKEEIQDAVQKDLKNQTTTAVDERKPLAKVIEQENKRAQAFSSSLKSRLPHLPIDTLRAMRHNLSSGLVVYSLTVKNNDGADPIPNELLEISKSTLTDLRKAVIDELKSRGFSE